ncbi:MAG TPA: tetratricopeptide repeat protein [Polyangiales bacterium]|nr:tetratricopeptide repeat protein [Polyangiales bacterium]
MLFLAACGGAKQKPADTSADELLAPAPKAKPKSSSLVREAEQLLAKGDAQGAHDKFAQAVMADANDVRAQLGLGLSAEALGKPDEAEKAYRAAISADTSFAEAHNNLALLLRDRGDDAGAIEELKEAVRLDPSLASAQANLALAYEDAGRTDEAEAAYAKAVQLAPKDALLRANRALFLIGRGNAEGALADLRAGLAAAQGDRAALVALGNGFRRAGKPDEAVRALNQAIGGGEPTPALLAELALAQVAAKQEDDAKITLEKALGLDPKYATAYYVLGSIEADRDPKAARKHYEKCIALEPNGPLAAKAKAKLAQLKK